MATVETLPSIVQNHARQQQYLSPNSPPHRPQASRQRFVTEFSQCLYDFVVQLLPTPEELAVKEDVRKLLERLIRTIEPDSRLLSFGSTANGFSLRNSDMDLCCLIDSEERLSASDLVTMLGDLLERETKFHVKPLPHARIPIVKLSLDPSPGLPFGIACDIGFENRLALENTRLLMCYAMIDPARVRTMVLFLKVWSKRRKINSPYTGTLSSYGYVLLVIFFLVHVKSPPVLPNLQQMPPLREISKDEIHLNEYNIWFFDDIELLRQRWKSSNTETVAELLIDFFKYFSRDFAYNVGVASIRAGLLRKESKGWQNEFETGSLRERNRFCIEDPFETDYNVARCVTKDGLYTIRGEFMRASRVLAARPDRAIVALAALCEERKNDELLRASPSRAAMAPPRLPPQVPYTVSSSPMRPSGVPVPVTSSPSVSVMASEISSPPNATSTGSPSTGPSLASDRPLIPSVLQSPSQLPLPLDQLEHMAPKRGKWTSPPPPEAPEEDRSAFEDQLGRSLALATVSTSPWAPRYREGAGYASSNSEIQTDDGHSDLDSDDVHSVRSFTEEGAMSRHRERQITLTQEGEDKRRQREAAQFQRPILPAGFRSSITSLGSIPTFVPRGLATVQQGQGEGLDAKMLARLRGRPQNRLTERMSQMRIDGDDNEDFVPPARVDSPRRSMSGPARASQSFSALALPTLVPNVSLQRAHSSQTQSPVSQPAAFLHGGNIYYETTTPTKERLVRAIGGYTAPMTFTSPRQSANQTSLSPGPSRMQEAAVAGNRSPSSCVRQRSPRHLAASSRRNSRLSEGIAEDDISVLEHAPPLTAIRRLSHAQLHSPISTPQRSYAGRDRSDNLTPIRSNSHSYTPPIPHLRSQPLSHLQNYQLSSHAALPSSPHTSAQSHVLPQIQSHLHSQSHLHTRSRPTQSQSHSRSPHPVSPFASPSSGSGSPPQSCSSSLYAPSLSPLSTSPPSPVHSEAAPIRRTSLMDPSHCPDPWQSISRDHSPTAQAPILCETTSGAGAAASVEQGRVTNIDAPPETLDVVLSCGEGMRVPGCESPVAS